MCAFRYVFHVHVCICINVSCGRIFFFKYMYVFLFYMTCKITNRILSWILSQIIYNRLFKRYRLLYIIYILLYNIYIYNSGIQNDFNIYLKMHQTDYNAMLDLFSYILRVCNFFIILSLFNIYDTIIDLVIF